MRKLGPRRVVAGLALLAVVAVVVGVILGTRSPSSPTSTRSSGKASGSTTVQRRDLVATDTESGTLSYSD